LRIPKKDEAEEKVVVLVGEASGGGEAERGDEDARGKEEASQEAARLPLYLQRRPA
jgi:hypothetical protein